MAKYRSIHSLILSITVLLTFVFIVKSIMRYLGIESFVSIQDFYQQFLEAQKMLISYGYWVGYAYRTADKDATAEVLNDFKRRVFQDSCEFKDNWRIPPPGMPSPNGASNAVTATAAYSAYIKCLRSGVRTCYDRLEDARVRFMKPGCWYKNPINTSDPITVAFK